MLIRITAAALVAASGAACAQNSVGPVDFTLEVLHTSDGESQLLGLPSPNEAFGGVARFSTAINSAANAAAGANSGALKIYAGDSILAGPEFGLNDVGEPTERFPYFDSIAIDLMGFDVLSLGNHEFDFGTGPLASHLTGIANNTPAFLSANLDFTGEPALDALVVPSAIFNVAGRQVGVIGATTEQLGTISSTGNTIINPVIPAVQAEIDNLRGQGVEIIILSAHLQGVSQEYNVIANTRGLDAVVAAGGGELFANPADLLIPGDSPFAAPGPLGGTGYPRANTDLDGRFVPVVSTSGDYAYFGRLVLEFDAAGELVSVGSGSGQVRISSVAPDAVDAQADIQTQVTDPVTALIGDATRIGSTEVGLDGRRSEIRAGETNQGNLTSDAYLDAIQDLVDAGSLDLGTNPVIAMTNGGGTRNDSIIGPGAITDIDIASILSFDNEIATLEGVTPEIFLAMMENGVSAVFSNEDGTGRYPQISGFKLVYDSRRQQASTDDLTFEITQQGERVISITLDDGTKIAENGEVVPGAPTVTIVTSEFTAGFFTGGRGGDEYPIDGTVATRRGVSEQDALTAYIQQDLGGTVRAADYPAGGEGRIRDVRSTVDRIDANEDGRFTFADAAAFGDAFVANELAADLNGDNILSMADVELFLETFFAERAS